MKKLVTLLLSLALVLKIKKEGYHVEEKTTDHHRGM